MSMSRVLPDPSTLPPSPLQEVKGLRYFPRMTAKIRLQAQGRLWSELHDNLGKGSDGKLCDFMQVDYAALAEQVRAGLSDEQALQWCAQHGRALTDMDVYLWNHLVMTLGIADEVTPILQRRKEESGLAHRDDIISIAHYIDVDEGRLP